MTNRCRILIPLAVWAAAILLRAHVRQDLYPWQPLWIVWILATSLTAGCVGWIAHDIHRR